MSRQEAKQHLRNVLISEIQSSFPLMHDPYAALADRFESTAEEVYEIVVQARESGMIRRMGPVFDSHKLGYVSTLCATSVPVGNVEEVAAFINGFPHVTHNYLRDNRYNIWFTVIARDEEALLAVVKAIEGFSKTPVLVLPATKLFKIKVDFNLTGSVRVPERGKTTASAKVTAPDLTAQDTLLIRALQKDTFGGRYPYEALANAVAKRQAIAYTEEQLLTTLRLWRDCGVIRRFGATVRHHEVGFHSNVMGVWDIPSAQVEQAGALMSRNEEVSHCYERPRLEEWPHNLYTMIHGHDRDECDRVISRIRKGLAESGITAREPTLLHTQAEFKKTSMRYFCEDTHEA